MAGLERRYGIGMPAEIFFEVRRRLKTHHTLICCGYGWGDKGINNRVNQWVRRDKKNKLVLLHKFPEELRQMRFWRKNRENYEKYGRLEIVPKWLQDCTLKDILPYLKD